MFSNVKNTTYKELADACFDKIKDIDLASMNENIAYEIVEKYISSACTQFQSCTQDLNDRNDEIGEFNFTLTMDNFNMLVNYMVIEWLDSNYLFTTNTLKSRLSSSDFHSLNSYNMLGKITELREMLKNENDQLARNKSYLKSDIFNMVSNRGKVQS